MKQMKISDDMKVSLNFGDKELSKEFKELKPIIFNDGDLYCCLLGPDYQAGIFGYGTTPKKAIGDREKKL